MNNDLISREALKKAIDDYAEKRQDTLLWQSDVEEIIDNAPIKFCDLSVGDKFTLNCKWTEAPTSWGTRKIKGDKRVFVKDQEGATEIIDIYGNKTNGKVYPYLTMPVYRIQED